MTQKGELTNTEFEELAFAYPIIYDDPI